MGRLHNNSPSLAPDGITQDHWDLAGKDASLGVGHIWYDLKCPAYRTLDPNDCTCNTSSAP